MFLLVLQLVLEKNKSIWLFLLISPVFLYIVITINVIKFTNGENQRFLTVRNISNEIVRVLEMQIHLSILETRAAVEPTSHQRSDRTLIVI